ncbi:MAG: sugar ABC transporter permease [Anaerolineales bacterium]|jgi:multiple sugar transport system permease protein
MDANRILKKSGPYMFLLPAIFVFGVALFYPVFYGIRLSFFQWSFRDIYAQAPKFVGLKNYIEEFKNPQFLTSLRVTTVFIFATMVSELLVGLALALLTERKTKGLTIFRTIFILPIMIAPVVVGVIWRYLYNANYGLINYFLSLFGADPVMWLAQPATALASIIITDIWQWTPFVYLLLLAGLQTVPDENIEAAVVDGATYMQRLLHVVLPIMKPIIGITIVLRLVDAMRGLVVMYIMTFGGPGLSTEVLSLHIYKTAFIGQRLGRASANAVVLILYMLVIALILLGLFRTERRKS